MASRSWKLIAKRRAKVLRLGVVVLEQAGGNALPRRRRIDLPALERLGQAGERLPTNVFFHVTQKRHARFEIIGFIGGHQAPDDARHDLRCHEAVTGGVAFEPFQRRLALRGDVRLIREPNQQGNVGIIAIFLVLEQVLQKRQRVALR